MNKQQFNALHGYCYLFKCGDQYKIGYSKSPGKRMRQFRTGSPIPVNLVHMIRTVHYRELEKQLHYRFAEKREEGEWFSLNEEDVVYIKSLDKYGRSPEENAERDRSQAEWDAKQKAIREAAHVERMNILYSGFASGAGELAWVD